MADQTTLLRVDSSGTVNGSSTRALLDELVTKLTVSQGPGRQILRDVAEGIPYVDEHWITANFTDRRQRTLEQRRTLAFSDLLIEEIQAADVVAIGVPVYNFGVPAALKAWVDMIARAGVTFRYTDKGPVGLLSGKKAYLVVASGGVAVDSALDFATPYMRQALRFVGINDIEVIAADQQNMNAGAVDTARQQMDQLFSGTRGQAARTTTKDVSAGELQ